MEHGWGTNAREQILENGDLKVPRQSDTRWQVAVGSKPKRFNIVRAPTESNIADINTKPLGEARGSDF